jgi:hypothetical protein
MKKYFKSMTDRTIDRFWERVKHKTKVHCTKRQFKFGSEYKSGMEEYAGRFTARAYSAIDMKSFWYRKATWLFKRTPK